MYHLCYLYTIWRIDLFNEIYSSLIILIKQTQPCTLVGYVVESICFFYFFECNIIAYVFYSTNEFVPHIEIIEGNTFRLWISPAILMPFIVLFTNRSTTLISSVYVEMLKWYVSHALIIAIKRLPMDTTKKSTFYVDKNTLKALNYKAISKVKTLSQLVN